MHLENADNNSLLYSASRDRDLVMFWDMNTGEIHKENGRIPHKMLKQYTKMNF